MEDPERVILLGQDEVLFLLKWGRVCPTRYTFFRAKHTTWYGFILAPTKWEPALLNP